ncbi:transcriptional regulator NrdR [Candidatus Woesearchaeota archaeon]|nr:transcriptional regulator NrdR [Candidatus Woesearchaeota archaeon]
MICPYCSHPETKVLDSRESEDMVRRRRECLKCEKRFTTYERVEIDLTVIKKDGRREQFSREKLKTGIIKATQKRPIETEKIENTVNEIEQELRNLKSHEIPSKKIGDKVMKKLKDLDNISYIRFASVYKDFRDIDDLVEVLKK